MSNHLSALYQQYFGREVASTEPIGGSASNRQYVRLYDAEGHSAIAVSCPDLLEKRAFCELDKAMLKQGISVPQVLIDNEDCYLQEDLGRTSLYDLIQQCQKKGEWDDKTVALLHQVMRDLVEIQFKALSDFDLSLCCREQHFSATNIRWDLNYFKYCFLKCTGVTIDEIRLQQDFDRLEQDLLEACRLSVDNSKRTFLYRDFQSRNVMIHNDKPYYIDFQSGYEGPIYYDVASFLWQARAAYPEVLRKSLLETYLSSLRQYIDIDDKSFYRNLGLYVFFRLMQVLGAYGFRGIFERKAAFLSPIAQALAMIKEVGKDYGYIHDLIRQIDDTPFGQSLSNDKQPIEGGCSLTVKITSFSFKKGIPEDYSGNGGGFVFDCRAPHNPGRYAEYKHITGLDQPVLDFLEGRDSNPEHRPIGTELTMPQYLEHVYAVVDPAVETYMTRGFTSLVVNFGCTGGQHRSVYGAQHLAEHLHALHPELHIILTHRELNKQTIY